MGKGGRPKRPRKNDAFLIFFLLRPIGGGVREILKGYSLG